MQMIPPQQYINKVPSPQPTHSYSLRRVRKPNPKYTKICQNIPKYTNGYANACMHITCHELCNAVLDTDSGKMMEYRHLIQKYPEIWSISMTNEFGRLLQGVDTRIPAGSDTMQFIPKSSIPIDKSITHARIVCDCHPLKPEPIRTRLTVDGNRLMCPHETSTDAADLILIKFVHIYTH